MREEIERILDEIKYNRECGIYGLEEIADKILQLFQTKIDSCEDEIKELICCEKCTELLINIIKERCK